MKIKTILAVVIRHGQLVLIGAVATMSLTQNAIAQSESTSGAAFGALDEVIVTARRQEESAQDVPISITAFSGDDLAKQSAFQLIDVEALAPGLKMRYGSGDPSVMIISLRGTTHNRQDVTVDPAVAVYVDDVLYAHPIGQNVNLFDVGSVEVLSGPQGTLFGRNTVGGAIVMKTNDPDFTKTAGSVTAGVGSDGFWKLGGVINAPLSDRTAIRFVAETMNNDGYRENDWDGSPQLKFETLSTRLKFKVQVSEQFSLLFGGEYNNNEGFGPGMRFTDTVNPANTLFRQQVDGESGGTASIDDFAGLSAGSSGDEYETITWSAYGKAFWDLSWGGIDVILTRRDIDHEHTLDADATPYQAFDLQADQDIEATTAEIRLHGTTASGRTNWQFGAYYFEESGEDNTFFIQWPVVSGTGGTPQDNDATFDTESLSFFGQATFAVSDRINLTAGVRSTSDDKSLAALNTRGSSPVTCVIPVAARVDPAVCLGFLEFDNTETTYLLSLDYAFTDDTMAYIRNSSGYRAGGLNQRINSLGTLNPFKPETLNDIEVGVKSEFSGGRFRLNVSAYFSDWKDVQWVVNDQVNGVSVQNTGDAEQRGLEVRVDAQVTDNFRLSLNGSNSKVKYVKLSPNANPALAKDQFAGVPDTTLSLTAEITASESLTLRGDYSWNSDINYTALRRPWEDLYIVPSYGLLNLRVSWRRPDSPLSVDLWGRNVTDEDYVAYNLDFNSIGGVVSQIGQPANFGITLNYDF